MSTPTSVPSTTTASTTSSSIPVRRLFPLPAAAAASPIATSDTCSISSASCEWTISMLQFNILAANLATAAHFPYVKPVHLSWPTRRQRIVDEVIRIRGHDGALPDIIAFEECADYWGYFRRAFATHGYDSVYVKRHSITKSSWSGVAKHDGCAIFYRSERFELLRERNVNFKDSHDRVALLVGLRHRTSGAIVVACNTHLYWNPHKVTDQLAELAEVETAIDKMRRSLAKKFGVPSKWDIPVLLAGDFNNGPQSRVYAHMAHQFGRPSNSNNNDNSLTPSVQPSVASSVSPSSPSTPPSASSAPPSSPPSTLLTTATPTGSLSLPNSSMRSSHGLYSLAAAAAAAAAVAVGSSSPSYASSASSSVVSSSTTSVTSRPSLVDIESMIRSGACEPASTAVNYKRSWTIDYIFHSCDSLSAADVPPSPIVSTISTDDIKKFGPYHGTEVKKEHKTIEHDEEDDDEDNFGAMDDNGNIMQEVATPATNMNGPLSGPWWVWPAWILEIPDESAVRVDAGPTGWAERENVAIVARGEAPLDLSSNLNGIPNSHYASDHLPIFVEFRLGNRHSYQSIDSRLTSLLASQHSSHVYVDHIVSQMEHTTTKTGKAAQSVRL